MAKPQKKNGYTGISNELLQEMMTRNFSKRQLNILLFIMRLSYGNSQKYAYIEHLKAFELCGISSSDIKSELNYLVAAKVIFWHERNIFEIIKDYEKWKISLIKKFCLEKWNKLLFKNIKDKKSLQNTNKAVSEMPTSVFVKYQANNSGKIDSENDARQGKESIKESIKLLELEEQEKKLDFKIFGKYENVYLSESQYQQLSTLIMSEKALTEVIDSFSENLAAKKPGKLEPEFDGIQNHFVRLQSYWAYRKKNPEKFIEGFKKLVINHIKKEYVPPKEEDDFYAKISR